MPVNRAGSAGAPFLMTTIAAIHGATVALDARQGLPYMFSHLMATKPPEGSTVVPLICGLALQVFGCQWTVEVQKQLILLLTCCQKVASSRTPLHSPSGAHLTSSQEQ